MARSRNWRPLSIGQCAESSSARRVSWRGWLFDRVAELARNHGAADAAEPALTRREQQIAQLIKQGLSNKEIAVELRIGPATVKRYVHSLLEKFQVQRRSAVAARVR
jgi:DNA-binding NarL/FixJ family response regulator